MKKFMSFATSLLLVLGCVSCASTKPKAPITEGEVEISIPLSGAEYQSTAKVWRAVQSGTSQNIEMAKKVAMQNARQELAATIQNQVKAVIENYGRSTNVGTQNESESLYEELTRTIVNQQMNDVRLIAEKTFRLADGNYRTHVCLEMDKTELREKVADVLSKEERMRLQFDREQFSKVFDKEMENVEK